MGHYSGLYKAHTILRSVHYPVYDVATYMSRLYCDVWHRMVRT
jgi:hypothetical protein